MESLEIAVSTREATGKGGARKLRRDGRVPGILYSKQENLALTVDLGEFNKLLRRASAGNALLDVNVEGGKQVKALIKEIQRDPITGTPTHFDFLHIDMAQRVRVRVPINLQGTPVGVKRGGVLEERLRDLDLECVASEIPASIDVDISPLGPNQAVHVRDLKRDGITFLTPGEFVIAQVLAKKGSEGGDDEAPADGAAPAEGGEESSEG